MQVPLLIATWAWRRETLVSLITRSQVGARPMTVVPPQSVCCLSASPSSYSRVYAMASRSGNSVGAFSSSHHNISSLCDAQATSVEDARGASAMRFLPETSQFRLVHALKAQVLRCQTPCE